MEIFPSFLSPYGGSARRKEKVELRVRASVGVRTLHVTSSRDCRTTLWSPLSAIGSVGFQMKFEDKTTDRNCEEFVIDLMEEEGSGCGHDRFTPFVRDF